MADVNISKYRASVVRSGSTPATPGYVASEGQDPVDPPGNSQNHLPVTINPTATGLSITDSQILSGAGTVGQYIRGDGSLADFPSSSGGGSSVSYYLNGSISQGTIGGVAYKELNKVPILGTGTDFTISADGYIAQFLTDAGDPGLLEIPGGNWNFETYFSASSSGGTPSFYVELYKYDGSTFTLIASSSSSPELIAFGTNLNPYFSTLAVPTTALALTDRLAIRYYVTHSGRTITLHTENNHLCQVITTFTTGLTSLNGLTAQVQNLAVGTSGTDFNIASATATHTFNLPTASATNRGALSSADWTTFNNKQNALTLTTSGSSGASTLVGATLNVPNYTLSGLGGVPTSRQLTINGTAYDLSADRSWSVGTVTSVGLSSATSGVTIGSTPVTGSGTITLAIATASGSQNGLLSSTDWSTFNAKQNALTLTTTGTSGAATLVGNTLNIPQYQAAGTYVTAVTASSPLASSGGTTPNITIQQASGSQSGFLSSTDWTTFNNKQNALTNPVTGTGTTNYLPKFTGSTTIGNSIVQDTGTRIDIAGVLRLTPSSQVDIQAYTGSAYSNLYYDAASHNWQTSGGTAKMTLTSGGNLLVGTTTDNGARLQVSGNTYLSADLRFGTDYAGSNTAILKWQGSGAGIPNSLGLFTWGDARDIQIGGKDVYFRTEAGVNRMVLTSTGAATFSSTVTSNGAGFIIQGDQQYRMNGYNSGYSYMTTNAGFNSSYNGVGIFSNATNANSLPAWVLDLGGLDGPTWGGVADGFTISRKASGGSWASRFVITSSGNVGIGTSSPLSLLHINGSSSGAIQAYIHNTNGATNSSAELVFGVWSGAIPTGSGNPGPSAKIVALNTNVTNAATDLTFHTYSSSGTSAERMRITSGGNLLVGTTTDNGARLQISGAIYASDELYLDNGKYLRFRRSSGNLSIQTLGIPSGTDDVRLLTTGDFNVLNGSLTNLMTVKNGGNVGIGTSSPESLSNNTTLQIDGTNHSFVRTGTSNYGGYFATIPTADVLVLSNVRNPVTGTYSNTGKAASSISLFSASSNGYIEFSTTATNNSGPSTRMTITSSGNVLIGTTTDFSFLGTTSLNVNRDFNSGHNIRISNQANNSSASANLILGTFGNSWVNGLGSNSSTLGNNLYWAVDASTSPLQYKMVLTTGGNLLIGTTTDVAGANLNVNGNIRTAAPTGGNAANWRLGTARAGTITPNAIVRIEIAGVLVDLDARYV